MTVSELESRLTSVERELAQLKEKLERAETRAGIARGLQEAALGLGRTARDVVAELRTKHNLGRS